nr:30S ribosomal protein S27ae [Candidatus Woesearchaeota archaeon]
MAKKKVKNKVSPKIWKKYKVSGDKLERSKICPRCGPGTFMADHKDRYYCGKCHYLEVRPK